MRSIAAFALVAAAQRCCHLVDDRARLGACATLCPVRSGAWEDRRVSYCFDHGTCAPATAPTRARNGSRCAYLSGFPKSSTSFGTWFVAVLVRADCRARNAACAPMLAAGAPPAYAFRAWPNGTWAGSEAAAAVTGPRSLVFSQTCTKHAKFWSPDYAHLRRLDLVVPLRHPLEYPMSRTDWDRDMDRHTHGKVALLEAAFHSMEAKLNYAAARLNGTDAGGGGVLFYLKDTLERDPAAVGRQVADFLHLDGLADDVALAAAVAAAAALPANKADEHAWIVKRPQGADPAASRADRVRALERWFGADDWGKARGLWARHAAGPTAALFPWPEANATAMQRGLRVT